MARRMRCPDCGELMEKARRFKERIPEDPDCVRCREDKVRIRWFKVYLCSNCKRAVEKDMTYQEIVKWGKIVSWGPLRDKEKLNENLQKEMVQIQEEKVEMKKVIEKVKEKTEIEILIDELRDLPKINRAYIKEPRRKAPHLEEKGWKLLELHIVPEDRPPYFAFEKHMGKFESVWEPISELWLKKVGDIYLVTIVDQPIQQLPHI